MTYFSLSSGQKLGLWGVGGPRGVAAGKMCMKKKLTISEWARKKAMGSPRCQEYEYAIKSGGWTGSQALICRTPPVANMIFRGSSDSLGCVPCLVEPCNAIRPV